MNQPVVRAPDLVRQGRDVTGKWVPLEPLRLAGALTSHRPISFYASNASSP